MNFRQKHEGKIISIINDPYDPEHHAWVNVTTADGIQRLLISRIFCQENNLAKGKNFSWKTWTIPLLNFFSLNPIQNITKDHPPTTSSRNC